jgi:hypothetical protein
VFDFPNSPSEGTTFAPSGGPVYVYTGGVWRMQGTSQVVTAEARNRIVNPAMQISQENARTASNAINYYPADQWRTAGSGPVLSSASVASPTPGIDPYHSYLNCTTAKPSLAAGDYYIATQTIEGIRLADFGWGTANAKPIVVRLVLMTNFTGTYCLSIRTASSDRSYVVPFTVDSTYSEKVVAIPGDTGGTWPTDTSAGLLFSICACAGTTYQTATPNVWQSGNFLATTTQTNLAAATSQLIRYSHVGLYLDPNNTGVPPPWQMPDEAQELAACMRYYQAITGILMSGYGTAGAAYYSSYIVYPLRVAPTGAFSGISTNNSSAPSIVAASTTAIKVQSTTTPAAGGGNCGFNINLSARM